MQRVWKADEVMLYYKVRRKSDGLFARNSVDCRYGGSGKYVGKSAKKKNGLPNGWGIGQVYSDKAFMDIRRLYNGLGAGSYNWNTRTHNPNEPGSSGLLYKDIELVKYGPNGEIVVWTDTECKLTKAEADAFIPTGNAPLTFHERKAGIRDEVGVLLDEIDQAEKDLTQGKAFDMMGLTAKIEIKRIRLLQAAEELKSTQEKFKDSVMKRMGIV